jgi:CO/xanthine dehydrogenase FAD-binding subunit
MQLPKFTYYRLSSRAEASRLLKEYGSRARLVAGGTDLYPRMKYGVVRPQVVISLKDLPVKNPEVDEAGTLHIDPLMTLADLAASPLIREKFPMLTQAALSVASGQVRNMATVGGNICLENRCLYYNQSHSFQFVETCFKRAGDRCYLFPQGKKCFAVFVADTVPALISLGAVITLTDGENVRSLPLGNLYTGDAVQPLDLEIGEILAGVIIPPAGAHCGMAFKKFSIRGGVEFAAFNVATLLHFDGDRQNADTQICTAARLTVGAISQAPVRLAEAEASLLGRQPTLALFKDVARIAVADIAPLPHHGYSSSYLKQCLAVTISRVLESACANIRKQ